MLFIRIKRQFWHSWRDNAQPPQRDRSQLTVQSNPDSSGDKHSADAIAALRRAERSYFLERGAFF